MKYLIVNADGFGLTEGCNRGVYETIENGLTTSVSVNMNFPAAAAVTELQRRYPNVSVGVHLNPIVGSPVANSGEISSLINPETGEFWGGREFTRRLMTGRIEQSELEHELTSQLKKAFDMGVKVSHIDSHQNRHLQPFYFRTFLAVGKKMSVMRMRTSKYYLVSATGRSGANEYYVKHPSRLVFHVINRINMERAKRMGFRMADRQINFALLEKGEKYLLNNWIVLLRNLPDGYNEVYFHPAYPDKELAGLASYVSERDIERRILQEAILKEIVKDEGIRLVTFRDI